MMCIPSPRVDWCLFVLFPLANESLTDCPGVNTVLLLLWLLIMLLLLLLFVRLFVSSLCLPVASLAVFRHTQPACVHTVLKAIFRNKALSTERSGQQEQQGKHGA